MRSALATNLPGREHTHRADYNQAVRSRRDLFGMFAVL